MAGLHHVELWVADLSQARAEWGWLLRELDFERGAQWAPAHPCGPRPRRRPERA